MNNEILKGKIDFNIMTKNIIINGIGKYSETQRKVKIRKDDIIKFNLKIGDEVEYYGKPYETVHIKRKLS